MKSLLRVADGRAADRLKPLLPECVIRRELEEAAVAEQKTLRMTDVRKEQIGAGDVHRRQAGRHVRQKRIGAAGFENRIMDPPVEERSLFGDLADRVGVDADVPSAVPDGEVRQRAERDAAGARAGTAVAEAVRDHQRIAELLEAGRQIGRRQTGEYRLLHSTEADRQVVVGVQ